MQQQVPPSSSGSLPLVSTSSPALPELSPPSLSASGSLGSSVHRSSSLPRRQAASSASPDGGAFAIARTGSGGNILQAPTRGRDGFGLGRGDDAMERTDTTQSQTPSSLDIDQIILLATSQSPRPGSAQVRSSTPLGNGHANSVPDTRTCLFVGNLPFRVRWQDVKDLFRRAGTVLRSDVVLGPDNRSKGHGSVVMQNREDAIRAIDMFHGYNWQTRVLEVRPDRLPPEYEQHAPPLNQNHQSYPMGNMKSSHSQQLHPSFSHQIHPSNVGSSPLVPLHHPQPAEANKPTPHVIPLHSTSALPSSNAFLPATASPLSVNRSASAGVSSHKEGLLASDPLPLLPHHSAMITQPASNTSFAGSPIPTSSHSSTDYLGRSISPAPSVSTADTRHNTATPKPASSGLPGLSTSAESTNGSRVNATGQPTGSSRAPPPSHLGALPPPPQFGQSLQQPYPNARVSPNQSRGVAGKVLFVGNLPYHVQWQDLKDLFRGAGNITRADVALGPDGRSRGYGNVMYGSIEDAANGITMFDGYEFNGRRLQVRLERFENHTLNGGASSGANGGFNMRSNPSNPTPPSQANQAFAHPSSQQTSARSSHNGGPPPISIGMIYPLYGYEPPSPFHAPPSPFYGPSSPFHAPFQPPPLVQHLGSQPMVNLSTASQPPSSNFSSEAGNKALSQSRAAVITQIEPAVPHYSRANHPQRIALPPAYPMFGNGIPGNQGVSIGAMSPIQRNLPLMTPSMPSFQFGAFPQTPPLYPHPMSPSLHSPLHSPPVFRHANNPFMNPAPGAPILFSSPAGNACFPSSPQAGYPRQRMETPGQVWFGVSGAADGFGPPGAGLGMAMGGYSTSFGAMHELSERYQQQQQQFQPQHQQHLHHQPSHQQPPQQLSQTTSSQLSDISATHQPPQPSRTTSDGSTNTTASSGRNGGGSEGYPFPQLGDAQVAAAREAVEVEEAHSDGSEVDQSLAKLTKKSLALNADRLRSGDGRLAAGSHGGEGGGEDEGEDDERKSDIGVGEKDREAVVRDRRNSGGGA